MQGISTALDCGTWTNSWYWANWLGKMEGVDKGRDKQTGHNEGRGTEEMANSSTSSEVEKTSESIGDDV